MSFVSNARAMFGPWSLEEPEWDCAASESSIVFEEEEQEEAGGVPETLEAHILLNEAFLRRKVVCGDYIISSLTRAGGECNRKKIRKPSASRLGSLVLHPALYRRDHVSHIDDLEQLRALLRVPHADATIGSAACCGDEDLMAEFRSLTRIASTEHEQAVSNSLLCLVKDMKRVLGRDGSTTQEGYFGVGIRGLGGVNL
jgi:hypothetical protein